MKKTLSVLLAVAMVLGAALTANAATSVQVTLTSPTITKAPDSCEKAGAVTFSFPAGAVLTAGDWWYMDLPENATLCKDIDYLIIGAANPQGADHWVAVDDTLPTLVNFANIQDAIGGPPGGLEDGLTEGPLTVVYSGSATSPGGVTVADGNMAIRVLGQSGTRRVTLYLADDHPDVDNGTIIVNPDNTLNIKILDGARHNTLGGDSSDTRIITDTNGTTFAGSDGVTVSATGTWRLFGQDTADAVPGGSDAAKVDEYIDPADARVVPYVENTLCVNAENASGNLHVSFCFQG